MNHNKMSQRNIFVFIWINKNLSDEYDKETVKLPILKLRISLLNFTWWEYQESGFRRER